MNESTLARHGSKNKSWNDLRLEVCRVARQALAACDVITVTACHIKQRCSPPTTVEVLGTGVDALVLAWNQSALEPQL